MVSGHPEVFFDLHDLAVEYAVDGDKTKHNQDMIVLDQFLDWLEERTRVT